jgi:hypothetical protein
VDQGAARRAAGGDGRAGRHRLRDGAARAQRRARLGAERADPDAGGARARGCVRARAMPPCPNRRPFRRGPRAPPPPPDAAADARRRARRR